MKISYCFPAITTMTAFPALLKADAFSFSMPARNGVSLWNGAVMLDTPFNRMIRDSAGKCTDSKFSMHFDPSVMKQRFNNDTPRYKIISTEEEFKIALDIPGVSADDIDISLDTDGTILTISGSRESKGDGYVFSTKFSQSFSLDPTVNIDKISAQLENGVLVIAAPLDVHKLEENIRKIPIQSVDYQGTSSKSIDVTKGLATDETKSDDDEGVGNVKA